MMSIDESNKIDLNQLINEFVQMVSDDSSDLSTDPNVKRVKIIKADGECAGCGTIWNDEQK